MPHQEKRITLSPYYIPPATPGCWGSQGPPQMHTASLRSGQQRQRPGTARILTQAHCILRSCNQPHSRPRSYTECIEKQLSGADILKKASGLPLHIISLTMPSCFHQQVWEGKRNIILILQRGKLKHREATCPGQWQNRPELRSSKPHLVHYPLLPMVSVTLNCSVWWLHPLAVPYHVP